uniref:Probable Delta(7)-sterol 5(6)-desaturase n=1 Tax=Cacopsylla melanoneura TaxID=428564 RepID=A0A8D8U009_9HEMI
MTSSNSSRSTLLSLITKCLLSSTVMLMAASLQGDWLFLYFNIKRHMDSNWSYNGTVQQSFAQFSGYFKDLPTIWLSSCLVGYGIYFAVGGFLHFYFYVGKRDKPNEWKCQPTKWLSRELELDEIKVGCLSLLSSNTLSALVVTYIVNGGPCTVYWTMDEYSWLWWFLQWPVIFIYQDYSTYWNHRLYHTPFLYKNFHKVHHRYKQPTAFSVTAIHPVEMLHIQICLMLPLFVIPVHYVPFQVIAIYTFYHGIIVHSGVDLKSFWWQPWQPDPMFHDNHHQYFHVNFGFNIFLWDKIHGTYRKKDRIYREYLFSGKGKPIHEATKEELVEELEEREAENLNAYRKTGYEKEFSEPGKPFVQEELLKRS